MIKGAYEYLFHCNEYDGKWYCFHREDANAYWSGGFNRIGPQRTMRLASGQTPGEAWKNMQLQHESNTELQ